jgi:hypothetical protein
MKGEPVAPRCYILDEHYRLVLACSGSPNDPLNEFYAANSNPDALPPGIDEAVRSLTVDWRNDGAPCEATTVVSGVRLTVAPLQGSAGRHIAVFAEAA